MALAGGKGYRAEWIDDHLLELSITPVIPSKANQGRDGWPVMFDKAAYRKLNIVAPRCQNQSGDVSLPRLIQQVRQHGIAGVPDPSHQRQANEVE